MNSNISNLCKIGLCSIKIYLFLILVSMHFSVFAIEPTPPADNRHLQVKDSPANLRPNINPTMTLAFVGDVIIHERLRKYEEIHRKGFHQIWSEIQPFLASADITYANLEGPVATEFGGPSGFPRFNFPDSIIPELKIYGFDIVSTANNHSLDKNSEGLDKTIEKLNKYQLLYTGTLESSKLDSVREESKQNQNSLKEFWTVTHQGPYKIAWLSCTEMTNGLKDKKSQVLYCFKDRVLIKKIITYLNETLKPDSIILLPHWGEEHTFEIEKYRQRWAHILLDHGAQLVIGSHPHVVQKTEIYKSKKNDKSENKLILYSLGNFISNQVNVINKASIVFYLKLKKSEISQKLEIIDYKYLPIYMHRNNLKDGTSEFKLKPVFDFKLYPQEASDIWKTELSQDRVLKSKLETEAFFKK